VKDESFLKNNDQIEMLKKIDELEARFANGDTTAEKY